LHAYYPAGFAKMCSKLCDYFCSVKTTRVKLKKAIRNLIIGETNYIESRGQYKRAMLSGQFALLAIGVSILYMGINLLSAQDSFVVPILSLGIMLFAISIYHHRIGEHCTANYFLLPTANIVIYLFASSESPNTAIFIFFLLTSLASFVVFDYTMRLWSILFTVFTYALFVLAYFVDFSFLPKRYYSSDELLLNVIINFTIGLPVSAMMVYLLISLNYYNDMQLVQNNKLLMKANNELDRFVYSTSHDLRAPLTSVMGLINIAENTDDTQEVRKYMGMMRDRISSLDKFIKDITDYSRNNRLHIGKENIKLAPLVSEVWDTLQHATEAQYIHFQMEIPEEMEVLSDRSRLTVILSNLISNAIRYHDQSKHDRYIRLRVLLNGYGFYLKVEDNGQGISPEYHHKVFDMFYRANEKSNGSGLGLYIVKETLDKLSGSIHLESAPGVGSTFTIRLPYAN
jgi:signal transduction histidine kinase